jgi:hypothetical protein
VASGQATLMGAINGNGKLTLELILVVLLISTSL